MDFTAQKQPALPNLSQSGLAILSGCLLALSFPNFNLAFLGWICFAPLLIAVKQGSLRTVYLIGLLAGMSGFSLGFYWVAIWAEKAMEIPPPLNFLFIVVFAFSFGQIFGVIALGYRWLLDRTRWDELLVFPVVLVSVFSVFPLLFKFRPGDSQWLVTWIIQPIDITGIAGLDFVMAVGSVLVYKLVGNPLRKSKRRWMILALIGVGGWLTLGWIKHLSWESELKGWSTRKIGIVQPNREVSLSKPMPDPGYSREYPWEMAISEQLVAQGAQLLIWPEGYLFGYAFWDSVQMAFQRTIARLKTPLLFYDVTWQIKHQKRRTFNSIIYLNETGERIESYEKIKLVPFSEYLPVVDKLAVFDWILGDYLDSLTPGKEPKVFKIGEMRIVPKTCYEPLFPAFVAESIGEDGAGKVILVQSQDGWFGQSSQPYQHLAVTVMRAVENRVPLIHVIQNGPSAVIRPDGGFAFLSPPFVRGGWVAALPFDPQYGGSFYSRFPNLFENGVRTLFLILLFSAFFNRKSKRTERL